MISRWDPFRDLAQLQDRINRIFEDRMTREGRTEPASTRTWAPLVDIYEDESELVVRAEIPGVKREDINIQVTNDELVISGERKFEEDGGKRNYMRLERPYGPFQRSFSIGLPVKTTEVKASYKDGVLEVTVPKAEETKPKQVQVEVV